MYEKDFYVLETPKGNQKFELGCDAIEELDKLKTGRLFLILVKDGMRKEKIKIMEKSQGIVGLEIDEVNEHTSITVTQIINH